MKRKTVMFFSHILLRCLLLVLFSFKEAAASIPRWFQSNAIELGSGKRQFGDQHECGCSLLRDCFVR